MTPAEQSGSERERINRAIEWRAHAEVKMAEARELLEDLVRDMPLSLERVQLQTTIKALIRAQATAADAIEEGQRMRAECRS